MQPRNGRFRRTKPEGKRRLALRISMAEAWSAFAARSQPEDGLVLGGETEMKAVVEQREDAKGESQ